MRARDLLSPGFAYFALVTLFLYLPIGLLILFSFNDSTSLIFPLKGFTLKWYNELLGASQLLEAMRHSLVLGLGSSLVATAFGTMAAIGIARFDFPGRSIFLAIASLPLVIPYVVLGVALLILFSSWGVPLSLWTVGAAHVVVNIPYVMLIVAARLAGFEQNLEEAAMDLGATPLVTFWKVTLPQIRTGLAVSGFFSFIISWDQVETSLFLVKTDNKTLPVEMFYYLQRQQDPVIAALSTFLIAVAVVVAIVAVLTVNPRDLQRLLSAGGR